MKKNILILILLITLGLAAEAQIIVAQGNCGENCTWILTDDNILTINGSGAIYEYNSTNEIPWKQYANSIDSIIIGENITRIGSLTFVFCSKVTNITIPENITSIGRFAFSNCPNLTTINFNAINCTDMGSGVWTVFPSEDKVTNLNIGENVQTIPDRSFSGIRTLRGDLIIPNSVKTIGAGAFSNCGFNGTLIIPNSVKTIGVGAFSHCDFNGALIIPESVTSIGIGAFAYCGFNGNLVLSNSLSTIEEGTFEGCNNFTGNLIIPEFVTSIGESAFSYCSGFKKLTIPNPIEIGDFAFANCSNLDSIVCLFVPSSIRKNTFSGTADNATFYVPCDYLEIYKLFTYWKDFNYGDCLMVGINDMVITDFSIFPNPTKDVLYIETFKEIKSITIYSMDGKLIEKNQYSFNSGQLNISKLNSGSYIINIETDNSNFSKIIIKK